MKRPLASLPGEVSESDDVNEPAPTDKPKPGRRKRGGALRKGSDIQRKSRESDFEVNDLYGGGAGGNEE